MKIHIQFSSLLFPPPALLAEARLCIVAIGLAPGCAYLAPTCAQYSGSIYASNGNLDHLLRRRKRRLYHTRSSHYNRSLSNDYMPVASCDGQSCAFFCTHGRAYACPRKLHSKHVSLRERSCCSRSSHSKGMARGGQSTSEDA